MKSFTVNELKASCNILLEYLEDDIACGESKDFAYQTYLTCLNTLFILGMIDSDDVLSNKCRALDIINKRCCAAMKNDFPTTKFAGVTYLNSFELFCFLNPNKFVQHYAYVYHDKDLHEDGTALVPRIHFLIYTSKPMSISEVDALFSGFAFNLFVEGLTHDIKKTLVNTAHDMLLCYRYLRHLDYPDKYQYSEHDIICDDLSFWRSIK